MTDRSFQCFDCGEPGAHVNDRQCLDALIEKREALLGQNARLLAFLQDRCDEESAALRKEAQSGNDGKVNGARLRAFQEISQKLKAGDFLVKQKDEMHHKTCSIFEHGFCNCVRVVEKKKEDSPKSQERGDDVSDDAMKG